MDKLETDKRLLQIKLEQPELPNPPIVKYSFIRKQTFEISFSK